MSDTRKYEPKLRGVGCDACECSYHSEDGNCCADSIKVKNEKATQKAETYCGTFKPRCGDDCTRCI